MIECHWRIAIVLFPSCRRCLCLDRFTVRESRQRERESDKSGLLHSTAAAARSRVGDILEPSIVYTDHKHLGSKAE